MVAEILDEKELLNLSPKERAKAIAKKKKELDEKIKQESEELELKYVEDVAKKRLDLILEDEIETEKDIERQNIAHQKLEQTVKESKIEEVQKFSDYGTKKENPLLYENSFTSYNRQNIDSTKPSNYISERVVQKKDEIGGKFGSKEEDLNSLYSKDRYSYNN